MISLMGNHERIFLLLLFSCVVLPQIDQVTAQDGHDNSCTISATGEETCDFDKIRLGLEWFMNPDHLPMIVAQEHGIFAEFGLEVELVEPADHWEAVDEILEGRLDIAVTEPLHLAHEIAEGKPVLGFMRFLHTDGGVMYNKDSVKRPSDMCGKTISYPGSPGENNPQSMMYTETSLHALIIYSCVFRSCWSSYREHYGQG